MKMACGLNLNLNWWHRSSSANGRRIHLRPSSYNAKNFSIHFLEVLTPAYILREINFRLLAIGEEIRLEVELMQVPLKITFRNVRKTPDLEALIDKQAAKLERVCNHLVSCHMAVEKPQEHQRSGNPFRVRIDVTVPPQHELVVIRDASEGDLHERLPTVLRGAFGVMRRQIKKLAEKQRKQVKTHPEQEVGGFVSLLLRKEAYGFITSLDSREIYFHKNSLPAGEFDRLEIGTGVRWVEQPGEKGPQASSMRIVDKPGSRTGK
jgi:cold shock CspA family protein/ribosome-associated translation inhibitor RaiA